MQFDIFFPLAVILCCVLSIETFLQSNVSLNLIFINHILKKVLRVLQSNVISDHWKKRVIPYYAFSILKISLKTLLILLVIISIFLLPTIYNIDFFYFSISFFGIVEAILVCFFYLKLRNLIFE